MFSMCAKMTGLNADAIFELINNDPNIRKYDSDIIILGRPGPTGKSTLARKLLDAGYSATEISEEIASLVDYKDNENHIIIHNICDVIIVLNKLIDRKKEKRDEQIN